MSIDPSISEIAPEISEDAKRAPALKTYYGKPAVRPSLFGWKIGLGFYAVGVGAAAQIISEVFDLLDRKDSETLVRAGRYLGLAGAVAGPLLYIADLHTPRRWYNMLRIFRKSSLMSIGSWSLAAFGFLSGVTALGQALKDAGHERIGNRLSGIAGLPAALAAVASSVYKGTEMEETSIPLWASAFPLLSPLLSSSDSKAAASLLETMSRITGRRRGKPAAAGNGAEASMDKLSILSAVLELILTAEMARRLKYRLGKAPGRENLFLAPYGGLLGLSIAGPVLLRAVQEIVPGGRDLKPFALIGNLVGGFLLPTALILAGNRSGKRPEDYFSFTRPGERSPVEPAGPSRSIKRPDRQGPNPRTGLLLVGAAGLAYALTRRKENA